MLLCCISEKLLSDMAGSGQKAHNFFFSIAAGITRVPYRMPSNSSLSSAIAAVEASSSSSSSSSDSKPLEISDYVLYPCGEGPKVSEFLDFSAIPLLNSDIQGGRKFHILSPALEEEDSKGEKLSSFISSSSAQAGIIVTKKDLEKWAELVEKALSFIALILKPDQAPGFIMQLVSGRFNGF